MTMNTNLDDQLPAEAGSLRELYALEAFLEMFRGKDVFHHMKESDSPLLQRFISWDDKIDLSVFEHVKYNPTVEYVLGWIVELHNERNERLTVSSGDTLPDYIQNGSTNAARLFLDAGVEIDYNNVFQSVLSHNYVEIVKLLLADPRIDPGYADNICIKEASQHGFVEIVKALLADPRVDPSANHNRALEYAMENEHHEIVILLLADPRVNTMRFSREPWYGPYPIYLGNGYEPAVPSDELNTATSWAQAVDSWTQSSWALTPESNQPSGTARAYTLVPPGSPL